MANSFHKNKKLLENEISRLKSKLNETNKLNNDEFEMLKFNEGAYWMSN